MNHEKQVYLLFANFQNSDNSIFYLWKFTWVLKEQNLQNQWVHPKEQMWMEQCCSLLKQAKWSHKCRSLKQRWMELLEVFVLLVLYSCCFRIFFWDLILLLKEVGWSRCRTLKQRWMELCEVFVLLILFSCFFHFVLVLLLLKIVRWNKCRSEMELCEVYVLLVLFSCCFSFWYYYFIVEPN
jgi:hypothetical protein